MREWAKSKSVIDMACAILRAEFPMTVRQLFYRLVSVGAIENDRANYQAVSRLLTKARNDGRCEFEWIVDRSRQEYSPFVWDDPAGYLETVKRGYRKDYWVNQPNYVEVWTEKDAIIGSIRPEVDALGVTIRVGRGFLSTTKSHEIAQHFLGIEKPVTVLYLGDHDPSGRCIENDARDRVLQYGGKFKIRRIAILAADIRRFKLPPLRVKSSDSRTRGFLSRYSNQCVELDALPPTELRYRIKSEITALQDSELWERAVAVEKVECDSIEQVTSRWPRLGV